MDTAVRSVVCRAGVDTAGATGQARAGGGSHARRGDQRGTVRDPLWATSCMATLAAESPSKLAGNGARGGWVGSVSRRGEPLSLWASRQVGSGISWNTCLSLAPQVLRIICMYWL